MVEKGEERNYMAPGGASISEDGKHGRGCLRRSGMDDTKEDMHKQ